MTVADTIYRMSVCNFEKCGAEGTALVLHGSLRTARTLAGLLRKGSNFRSTRLVLYPGFGTSDWCSARD